MQERHFCLMQARVPEKTYLSLINFKVAFASGVL